LDFVVLEEAWIPVIEVKRSFKYRHHDLRSETEKTTFAQSQTANHAE
jgi:hypothetical protein